MAANNKNNTAKSKRKYKHLTAYERGQISALLKEGYSIRKIGKIIGRSASTVSREIKRGTVEQLSSNLVKYEIYYPDVGQRVYKERRSTCGARYILSEIEPFISFAEKQIKKEKWSPDAVVGYCKNAPEWKDKRVPCTKTLYNYIDAGFLNVRNIDLELKVRRKPNTKKNCKHKRIMGLSIEERPPEVDKREEVGHWEIDTVIGKKSDRKAILTLTERKSRNQLIRLLNRKDKESVNQAIQKIKEQFGELFKDCFKSITADNGSEFASLREVLEDENCPVYYAHPYSAWERATNERQNGLIRRFIPKGKSIDNLTAETIQRIENWCNNLPRKILGYKTPKQCFLEYIDKKQKDFPQNVALNIAI